MRLLGCMIVRDESDAIELVVRHNLALLDGIAVIDHGSVDGTREILGALVDEGLPVSVSDDPWPALEQKARINAVARHAFATTDVDWLFPLDADEFLVAPSRAALERTLEELPVDRAASFAWPTIVPSFDPRLPLARRLLEGRAVVDDARPWRKIAVPRAALAHGRAEIGLGQHELVAVPGAPMPPAPVPLPDGYAYAHVPIRSLEQFTGKFGAGWLAIVAKDHRRPTFSTHWGVAFDRLARGEAVDEDYLARFAANSGIEPGLWRHGAERYAPAPRFLRTTQTRYGDLVRGDALARILAQAERLLLAPAGAG